MPRGRKMATSSALIYICHFYYGFYGVEEMDVLYWERKRFSYKKGKKLFLIY
jgi:hypothetical protein